MRRHWWICLWILAIVGCQVGDQPPPPGPLINGDSLAAVWKGRGDSARDRQNIPLALQDYGQGLHILRQTHFELDSATHLLGGELSHLLAAQFAKLGAQDSARYYARQAILAKSWYYGVDAAEVAKSYTLLAQAYQNEQAFEQALTYRKKVLAIRKAAPGVSPKEMAIAWFNLADALIDLQDTVAAAKALDSTRIWLPPLAHADSLLLLFNAIHAEARLAETGRRFAAAQESLLIWSRLADRFGGVSTADRADMLLTAGNIARERSDAEAALGHYHAALLLYAPGNDDLPPTALPTLSKLGHNPNVFAALALSARAQAFHPDTAVSRHWVATADLAFKFWDGLRRGFWQWDVRSDLAGQADSEFEFALRMAIRQDLQNQAFEWLERTKENELLDIVQDLHRLNLAPVPADTIALARHYLSQRDQAPQYQDSLDQLLRAVRLAHPGQMQPEPVFTTLPALQARLKGDTTLLVSYFWGPQYLIAAAATATKDTMLAMRLEPRFLAATKALQKELQRDNGAVQAFSDPASQVYETILAPLIRHLTGGKIPKRLIVVPDGPLANIPFEALLTSPAISGNSFRDLPYLLRSTTVSYASSATLWAAYQDSLPVQGGVLGIGASGGYRNTGKLENVVDEVESAVRHLGGLAMIDDVTSEHTIKTHPQPFAILHAAAHGEFFPDAPLLSRLYFPDDPGRGEDGDLHAYEVMQLQLPQHMAVLSACETGPGKVMRGQEVMSMGYAFQVARCSTVVMSLWNVHDQSTRQIMDRFYAGIAQGLPVAAAFTQSRREFLATTTESFTHPCFWAPWLLAGNGELRFLPATTHSRPTIPIPALILAGSAIVVAIAAGGILWRRRRRFRWE